MGTRQQVLDVLDLLGESARALRQIMALGEGGGRHAVRGRVWYLVHHYGRQWVWLWAVCLVLSGLRLLDLCCCGSHAHADQDTIQILSCRILCSSQLYRVRVFFLPWPANSMAWPGGKKAVTGYSMPLQERENAATRGQQKVKMYYVYMLQGRASKCKVGPRQHSTHPRKGILVDFPVLPKSYVPPPSTHASRAS